ncbi:MAG TPA: Pvc16 family protein, partial [Burkholderiales bacterium]
VDLHFLFCLWLDTASREHTVLGWLLRELARYPVLDRGMTDSSGGFASVDRMQFIPSELSLDDMSKLWQLLGLPYRASLTYVVRNVQIGPETDAASAPVVATRFEHRDEVEASA